MRVRILVGLVVCLLSFRVAQAQQTENAPFGKLSGKATDQETREPIPDVDVVVKLNGAIRGHAATDSKGFYSITPLAPDTYTVEFNGDCFQTVRVINVPIEVDKTRFLNAEMCETVGVEPAEVTVIRYKVPVIPRDAYPFRGCGEAILYIPVKAYAPCRSKDPTYGSTYIISRDPAASIRIR